MARGGVKLSSTEIQRIRDMLERKVSITKIAGTIRASRPAVYYYAKLHNMPMNKTYDRPRDGVEVQPGIEEMNLAELPDHILFQHDRTYLF